MRALVVLIGVLLTLVGLVGVGMLFETPAPAIAQESVAVPSTVAPTPTAVDSLTRLIVRANPQIKDPKRIQIGDKVRVPTVHGVDTTYIAEPWMLRHSGAKGCFWLIAEAYLTRKAFAEAKAAPVVTDTSTVTLTNPLRVTEAEALPAWFRRRWGIFMLIATLGTLGLVWLGFLFQRRRDPYTVPPVIKNGLGGSNEYVLAEIRRASEVFYHDPGRQVFDPVHGQVESRTGARHFTARVGQRNGTFSQRDIPNGTQCVRITAHTPERDREVQYFEYWLTHCGNPVGEVGRDRFELPAGWEFVPNMPQPPQTARPTAAEPAVTAPAAAETEAPATDGRPEYAVDIQIDRTDTGLSIKGTSSRYVSRVKAGEYEVEF